MNDYFALHRIDSSGLTTAEKQKVNDWFQKHKPRECSISLRTIEKQESYEAFHEVCKPTLKNICVLWEDEESNYAGICTHGMMKGMISYENFLKNTDTGHKLDAARFMVKKDLEEMKRLLEIWRRIVNR